ncbi:MAG: hypothetical protein NWE77_00755 [Candidatus Bathyarchaeota archaeon]|nr:hypothetical protein [Candidatus Bathyarchaeota archaeon]
MKAAGSSFRKTLENEDDLFTTKINTSLLLILGTLLVSASAVIITYSAVLVVYRQQLLMEFLKTLILAALVLASGSGLLYYLFLERKMGAHERSRNPLGLASPQPIICEKCGATLYDGRKIVSPYKIMEIRNSRCPECGQKPSPKQ